VSTLCRFASTPLVLADLSQLLWAAQGVTGDEGRRAAPSAGALYPIELLVIAGAVSGLPAGIYRYRPEGHRLDPVVEGDARCRLLPALPWQGWVAEAPAVLAVTGVVSRTAGKYGTRAERYLLLEAGAVSENVYLQATALGLATALVGSFDDALLTTALLLPDGEQPLGLMPLGAAPTAVAKSRKEESADLGRSRRGPCRAPGATRRPCCSSCHAP
jgi:SagB-type dehydrogenase family enzyme